MAEAPKPGPTGVARPGVLSLSIKEKSALYAAYMPYLKYGGIFIPTNKVYRLGDEVFMLLTLMTDPNNLPVAGCVEVNGKQVAVTGQIDRLFISEKEIGRASCRGRV